MSALRTKNLYEAWEESYQNHIEDYQTPEQESVPATKVDWITRLPEVFSLQINRLKFVDGNAEKVLTPFHIEQNIYADRFLISNRQEV